MLFLLYLPCMAALNLLWQSLGGELGQASICLQQLQVGGLQQAFLSNKMLPEIQPQLTFFYHDPLSRTMTLFSDNACKIH